MKTIDIVAAIILLGLSALVVADTWGLPYWSTFAPGPAFAPVWVAAAGAVIGLVLLVQALRSRGDRPADWPDRTGGQQVLLGIGALWLLLLMLPFLGTLLSSIAFMLLFLLGVARRPLYPSLFTTALTVGIVEGVFGLWLNIDLPAGVIGF